MVGIKDFLSKAKHQNHASYREECVYLLYSINKRMEIITRIQVCPIWGTNLNSIQNGRKKAFLTKLKDNYRASQCIECVFKAQARKEQKLL